MRQCVYIVAGGWDYEGSRIVGVYDTNEKAKKCKKKEEKDQNAKKVIYDYIVIEKQEIK